MKELQDISILMVSMDTGLLKAGGAGDVIDRHKKYAQNLKRLDIIVFGKSEDKYNNLADNCKVYGAGKNLFSFFKAKQLAINLCKKYKYNLIDTQDPHLTGLLGLILKKKFDTKLEIHFHGDFWQNKIWLAESWKNKIYNYLQNKIVSQVDAIRVVNPRIKEKLVNDGISSAKIKVINTPVNEAEFVKEVDDNKINKIKNKYNNKKIVFFVGRLVTAKNLLFLLEVVKLLGRKRKDFVLLLAGQGEDKDSLDNFINNNSLEESAFLLGPKTHQELINYFKASYLHILLSTNESFGKTVIEAGMSGLASLASRTLGPSFIINNSQDGWLVDINDLKATVDKLNTLLDSPEEVSLAGQKAKENFVKHYGQVHSFEKVKGFWKEIVNEQL
ncbi:glycosyltransferase family 4 protein [bacterium]|jgi:glycosyltransferase involved in cell wall biosynthesis|nr:glycosyltransferase family 4 protein [Candidatus Komeilibacteria bacterium]MBT7552990.1 glycosyltransferase family 4 protein [bacterium]